MDRDRELCTKALLRQLVKNLSQMPPNRPVDFLPSVFGDKDNMVFAVAAASDGAEERAPTPTARRHGTGFLGRPSRFVARVGEPPAHRPRGHRGPLASRPMPTPLVSVVQSTDSRLCDDFHRRRQSVRDTRRARLAPVSGNPVRFTSLVSFWYPVCSRRGPKHDVRRAPGFRVRTADHGQTGITK